MVIFPLAPDQTIAQMWSNGARGDLSLERKVEEVIYDESEGDDCDEVICAG